MMPNPLLPKGPRYNLRQLELIKNALGLLIPNNGLYSFKWQSHEEDDDLVRSLIMQLSNEGILELFSPGDGAGGLRLPDGGTVGQVGGPLLTFDDAGNILGITGCKVGIGKPTPLGKLDVFQSTLGDPIIFAGRYNAEDILFFMVVEDDTYGIGGSFGGLGIYTSNRHMILSTDAGVTPDVFIDKNNHNVGIGTKTPGAKFEIANGDLIFTGAGSGLPFGGMYGNNIGWTSIAFGGGGDFVIIDTLTGRGSNATTFQNTQELLIAVEGEYSIIWNVSAQAAGVSKHIEVAIGINGTPQDAGRNHVETKFSNQEDTMGGNAFLVLAVNDTVSLMVSNQDDNTQVTIEHVTFTLKHVGGI